MNEELVLVYTAFLNSQVPSLWVNAADLSFPQALGSWVNDLIYRCALIDNCVRNMVSQDPTGCLDHSSVKVSARFFILFYRYMYPQTNYTFIHMVATALYIVNCHQNQRKIKIPSADVCLFLSQDQH